MIALALVMGAICLGVAAYFWKAMRLYLAGLSMLVSGLASGMLFGTDPNFWSLVALSFGFYQLFNIARLIRSRLHARHLRLAFFVGGYRLLALQFAASVLAWVTMRDQNMQDVSVLTLRWLQVLVAALVCIIVLFRLMRSTPKKAGRYYSDTELPTISVLIPARNEDRALEELLHTVVANDYPKMEVIVLDDQSNTPRISEIVKGFAQHGVRFIDGGAVKDNWLAKNQAYDALAQAASGDYLVFMGVDVRLGVDALRTLVHYALNNQVGMISMMPARLNGAYWRGFFTPLRNLRELMRPGLRIGGGVPALSTLWLINRADYDALGGMPAVARKVIPEHYFARSLARYKRYAFVRSGNQLHVATAKDLREQLDTSIRVIYPSQHRRMELNVLACLAMICFLFLPFLQLPHAMWYGEWFNAMLSGAAVLLLVVAHAATVTLTNPVLWPLAVINFPYLVAQEVALSFASMYSYEFGEVRWKGRTISEPVMQVIPHLPKID